MYQVIGQMPVCVPVLSLLSISKYSLIDVRGLV